jgi:hypothetical protein
VVPRLEEWGIVALHDDEREGYDRAYVEDPFGNRLELMEPR